MLSLFLIITLFTTVLSQETTCGINCQWNFNQETKTLSFTGSDKMKDFYSDKEIPWKEYLNQIEIITFAGSEITSIGQKAFQNLIHLKSVIFNGKITVINRAAFYNTGLTEIMIPNSVITIEKNVFEQNTNLKTVTFETNSQLSIIEEKVFKSCAKNYRN